MSPGGPQVDTIHFDGRDVIPWAEYADADAA
jgi:hypothetical protein